MKRILAVFILLICLCGILPVYADSDYEENYYPLEYIETNGTNYIDTGVAINDANYQFDIDAAILGPGSTTGYKAYNGRGKREGQNCLATMFETTSQTFGFGSGNSWFWTSVNMDNERHYFSINKSRWKIDNISGNISTSWDFWNSDAYLTLYIGGMHAKSATAHFVDNYAKEKVYGSKIYHNGTLVRNFVPALRKSDLKPGLYDLVNGVFYVNKGTQDDFTYPTIYNVEIPSSLNLNNSDLISVNYTVDSGVIGISMASSNNFKLINSSDSIPYSVSATEWPTLSAEGAFNIEISKDTQTIPAYSGAYTDILTFTISPPGSGS